jgi:hypothetical protein
MCAFGAGGASLAVCLSVCLADIRPPHLAHVFNDDGTAADDVGFFAQAPHQQRHQNRERRRLDGLTTPLKQLVLFGMEDMTFGSYLTVNKRILS